MSIIVQKFGGSSVADIDRLQRVAAKIVATRQAGHDVVVVVSAMGNTTNELLERSRQINPDPSRRELDMLLSVGERISMTLLTMAIHALGEEAISLTGSQSGIITNDAHTNARIIDVRPFRIQDELRRGHIVIVAGYQGTSYKREVTTLGRGGSDTTAVVLAAALSAEVCEIYSDVDGVFSSDPRVVLDAQRLDTISASEMLELARHGARVLHADAVAFAKRRQVALHARATHLADSQGTIIRPDGWPHDALQRSEITPTAVAALERALVLSTTDADLALEDLLHTHLPHLDLLHADLTPTLAHVILDPTHLAHLEHTAQQLRDPYPNLIVHIDHTTVSLIGDRLGTTATWLRKVRNALQDHGITAHRLWVRPDAITASINASDRVAAMRTLHALIDTPESA